MVVEMGKCVVCGKETIKVLFKKAVVPRSFSIRTRKQKQGSFYSGWGG